MTSFPGPLWWNVRKVLAKADFPFFPNFTILLKIFMPTFHVLNFCNKLFQIFWSCNKFGPRAAVHRAALKTNSVLVIIMRFGFIVLRRKCLGSRFEVLSTLGKLKKVGHTCI